MNDALTRLSRYLNPAASVRVEDGIPSHPIQNPSPGLKANAYYFGHPKWAKTWIEVVHLYPEFRQQPGWPWLGPGMAKWWSILVAVPAMSTLR